MDANAKQIFSCPPSPILHTKLPDKASINKTLKPKRSQVVE